MHGALAGRTLRQLDDLVLDVRVVGGQTAGDPVAFDGHGSLLGAEGLATPAGAEVGGVLDGVGVEQSLDLFKALNARVAACDGLGAIVTDQTTAGLLQEDADSCVFAVERQSNMISGGEFLGHIGKLVPSGRDIGIGQAGRGPHVSVDDQLQGGHILRGSVKLAVIGERLQQVVVEIALVLQLVAVGKQGAVGSVSGELLGSQVEHVGGIASGKSLGQLLRHIVGDLHGGLGAGLLRPCGNGLLDGLGLGVARRTDQHGEPFRAVAGQTIGLGGIIESAASATARQKRQHGHRSRGHHG